MALYGSYYGYAAYAAPVVATAAYSYPAYSYAAYPALSACGRYW